MFGAGPNLLECSEDDRQGPLRLTVCIARRLGIVQHDRGGAGDVNVWADTYGAGITHRRGERRISRNEMTAHVAELIRRSGWPSRLSSSWRRFLKSLAVERPNSRPPVRPGGRPTVVLTEYRVRSFPDAAVRGGAVLLGERVGVTSLLSPSSRRWGAGSQPQILTPCPDSQNEAATPLLTRS
jgi:hypothetical protein